MSPRTRFTRGRGAKRTSQWISAGSVATTIGSGSQVLLQSLNAAALAIRPFTVVRTQLLVMWESDQVVTSERPHGAMGMVVVTDQAVAVGTTAVPGPISEPDASWLVYQGLMDSFIDATSVGFQGNSGPQYAVDSKAMRKVEANQDLIMVVENRATVGAIFTVEGRILIKLH